MERGERAREERESEGTGEREKKERAREKRGSEESGSEEEISTHMFN